MVNEVYLIIINSFSVFINPVFWTVIVIVYIQYRKLGKMELKVLGRIRESAFKRTISSSGIGFMGGFMGSIIIALLGLSIEVNDFKYVIMASIFLALIHPRLLCFSYGGGILSLFSLCFGYPNINIPSVLEVVAILHIVEGLLIYAQGQNSRIPIFIERGERIVGGFIMTQFWPVPLMLFMLGATDFVGNNQLGAIVVVSALGYGDISVTGFPKHKARASALRVFLFGLFLLLIALVSVNILIFQYIGALASPVYHELLIQYGRKKERVGTPIFTESNRGVKILDVFAKGIGERIGLKTGNVIYQLNGNLIKKNRDIYSVLSNSPTYIKIRYYDNEGRKVLKEYRNYEKRIGQLGVLTVPDGHSNIIIMEEKEGIVIRIVKKILAKGKERLEGI